MKSQRLFADGQEVTSSDLGIMANLDASSMDYAVSEFFRLQMRVGAGAAPKGIIPFSTFKSDGTNPQTAGIVTSSGSANATVFIYPFRAFVAVIPFDAAPEAAWENTRTVDVVPPSGSLLQNGFSLDATDGTHSRCDLIYAKITIGAVSDTDTRFVRDPITGVISAPALTTEISDTYTLGVKKGTPFVGTTPARPTIDPDTSTDFFIPLAYIFLPIGFSAGSTVDNKSIHEVAPCVPLSRATGAISIRPANWHNKTPGSPLLAVDDFAATGHRAVAYAPSTWVGGEQLIVAASWNTTGPVNIPALNTTHIVDDSCDWRRRLFKWFATSSTAASALPWDNGGPRAGNAMETGYGQSFSDDGTGAFGVAGGIVAINLGTTILANVIQIYVDLSTGALKMKTPAASPNKDLVVWIEATGQFANSS